MASETRRNPDELGALWAKHGAKGEYLTGTINGVKVICFPNTHKVAGSNQPDWRVLKSKPREQAEHTAEPIDASDIPF